MFVLIAETDGSTSEVGFEELLRRLFGFELRVNNETFDMALANLFDVFKRLPEGENGTSSGSTLIANGEDDVHKQQDTSFVRDVARRLMALLPTMTSAPALLPSPLQDSHGDPSATASVATHPDLHSSRSLSVTNASAENRSAVARSSSSSRPLGRPVSIGRPPNRSSASSNAAGGRDREAGDEYSVTASALIGSTRMSASSALLSTLSNSSLMRRTAGTAAQHVDVYNRMKAKRNRIDEHSEQSSTPNASSSSYPKATPISTSSIAKPKTGALQLRSASRALLAKGRQFGGGDSSSASAIRQLSSKQIVQLTTGSGRGAPFEPSASKCRSSSTSAAPSAPTSDDLGTLSDFFRVTLAYQCVRCGQSLDADPTLAYAHLLSECPALAASAHSSSSIATRNESDRKESERPNVAGKSKQVITRRKTASLQKCSTAVDVIPSNARTARRMSAAPSTISKASAPVNSATTASACTKLTQSVRRSAPFSNFKIPKKVPLSSLAVGLGEEKDSVKESGSSRVMAGGGAIGVADVSIDDSASDKANSPRQLVIAIPSAECCDTTTPKRGRGRPRLNRDLVASAGSAPLAVKRSNAEDGTGVEGQMKLARTSPSLPRDCSSDSVVSSAPATGYDLRGVHYIKYTTVYTILI